MRANSSGTIRFDVTVAGRGVVSVLETIGTGSRKFTIARRTRRPTKATVLHVKVTPNARGKRAIRRAKAKVRVNLSVGFRPTGGRAGKTVRKTVTVRRR